MARSRETRREPAPPPPEESNDENSLFGEGGGGEEDDSEDEPIINVSIRDSTIAMYIRVLSFSQEAATALYDIHGIMTLDNLHELDDDSVKELARSFSKEGHPISILSQNRLRLLVFWVKHRWRTCRGVDDLTDVDYNHDVRPLQDQKTLEDDLDESKEPSPPTMILTQSTAATCFTNMKTYLAKCRGRLGMLDKLAYES
jgi:hypothetical protein